MTEPQPGGICCLNCHPELLPEGVTLDDFFAAALKAADEAKEKRAADMPDEQTAINVMFSAWLRLKELGWRDATCAPKDRTPLEVIEPGSTGIHQARRDDISFWIDGEWPSRPVLYRAARTPATTTEGGEDANEART